MGCDCVDAARVSGERLVACDVVIHGGGLYVGGVLGLKKLRGFPLKHLVVLTVGLADPASTDYSKIVRRNVRGILAESVRFFHLRGGMDYGGLGVVDRLAMALLKKSVEWKRESERTADDRELLATYGGKIDFTDRSTLAPLLDYVKGLEIKRP